MSFVDSIIFRVRRRYQGVREWIDQQLATVNEAPIFVLGNQKSGTTAIAVLLAKRTGQSVTWDLSTGHSALLDDIHHGAASLDDLIDEEVLAFSHDVIKDPNFTLLYDHLSGRFPRAQFVMIVRDPRDNIRSILDRLDLPGYREQLPDVTIESLPDGWEHVIGRGRFNIENGTYIDRLAERWKRMVHVYLSNEENLNLIRYEDFVDGKVEAIDDLASRLGLPAKNQIEEQVDRPFQPRGKRRNVEWQSFYQEANLQRIEERCRREMIALGYDDLRVA